MNQNGFSTDKKGQYSRQPRRKIHILCNISFVKQMLWEEDKYYLGFYLNLDQNVFEELKAPY